MKKLLMNIIIFLYANLAAQNTVKISSESESYIDPEILSEKNLLTFQTSLGKIWVAEIDSVTGLFKSNYGLNFLVDSNAINPSQTLNGPEFGVSKNGWAVFYTKPSNSISQIWQADFSDNKFISHVLLSDQQGRQTALVSKNSNSESVRVLYIKGNLSDGLMFWSDVISPQQETLIDSVDKGIRWIDETNSLIYVKQSGEFRGQLAIYDTDTKSEKIITNDNLSKSFPYAWFASEYNNELITLALIDGDTKIGIYKNNGGQYWEKVQEIIVPDTSAYKYFSSPEPFVVAGKSYISCVIKEIAGAYSNSEVWLFGLQQGKNKSYARKIEDNLGTIIRSDPETYLGENEVFVYYNVIENGIFNIYRSRTDLITLKKQWLTNHFILPFETDNQIDGHNEPHYILYNKNKSEHLNKLLLFFPGTNARPYDYLKFMQTATQLGYHAIGLSYENNESINLEVCPQTKDSTCHRRARYEIWFGEDQHVNLNISFSNSIINRLTKLLMYLAKNYADENWQQFLDENNSIKWERIISAGHSQGGGHAGFASKYFKVDKVIMISATDWVDGKTADWIRKPGPTEAVKYFGFIHTKDVPIYNTIPITWRDYGMLQFGLMKNIDVIQRPYDNSHSLTTSLEYPSWSIAHNFPIVDFETPSKEDFNGYVYSDVWEYLLENYPTSVIKDENEIPIGYELYQNYPNPFNPSTTINYTIATSPLNPSPYQGEGNRERLVTLKVYDILGREVATLVNEYQQPGEYSVGFRTQNVVLPSGVYFYTLSVNGSSSDLPGSEYQETKKMLLIK
ncbi:MAG: hypothetical protein AB1521_16030 [Bacteroidota bacterium]